MAFVWELVELSIVWAFIEDYAQNNFNKWLVWETDKTIRSSLYSYFILYPSIPNASNLLRIIDVGKITKYRIVCNGADVSPVNVQCALMCVCRLGSDIDFINSKGVAVKQKRVYKIVCSLWYARMCFPLYRRVYTEQIDFWHSLCTTHDDDVTMMMMCVSGCVTVFGQLVGHGFNHNPIINRSYRFRRSSVRPPHPRVLSPAACCLWCSHCCTCLLLWALASKLHVRVLPLHSIAMLVAVVASVLSYWIFVALII